jgi:hypothetical protein
LESPVSLHPNGLHGQPAFQRHFRGLQRGCGGNCRTSPTTAQAAGYSLAGDFSYTDTRTLPGVSVAAGDQLIFRFDTLGDPLVFIHKSGPMFRGIEGGVKISENNSVHVRSGRLNWVCVTERTHA